MFDAFAGRINTLYPLYRSTVNLVVSHLLSPVTDKPGGEAIVDTMGGSNIQIPDATRAVVGFVIFRIEVKNIIKRNPPIVGQIADGDIGFKRPIFP